jgi:hypothetical protein
VSLTQRWLGGPQWQRRPRVMAWIDTVVDAAPSYEDSADCSMIAVDDFAASDFAISSS